MSDAIGPKQPEEIELSAAPARKYHEDRIGPEDLAKLRSQLQSDMPSLSEMGSQIEPLRVSRGSSATSEPASPARKIRWKTAAIAIDAEAARVFVKMTGSSSSEP